MKFIGYHLIPKGLLSIGPTNLRLVLLIPINQPINHIKKSYPKINLNTLNLINREDRPESINQEASVKSVMQKDQWLLLTFGVENGCSLPVTMLPFMPNCT